MGNIWHITGSLIRSLFNTTTNGFQNKINQQVILLNTNGELKPIYLDRGKILYHTNSPKYPDGQYIRDYVEIPPTTELLNLHDVLKDVQVDEAHFTELGIEICMNISQKYTDITDQLAYFLKILPQDLLRHPKLHEYIDLNLPEEFIQSLEPRELDPSELEYKALVDKYYSLELLTMGL